MRALVTGCAGFIGSHLVDSLLADATDVDGVDCFTDSYGSDQKLKNLERARDYDTFSLAQVDLAEDRLGKLLENVDVVFHLAAEPGVRRSWGSDFDVYVRNNVLATQRLLEALKPWPEKRFVFASSSSVYGPVERFPTPETAATRPLSPYGVTKLAGEQLVRLYGANCGNDCISLRYFSVYGPRQRPDAVFHRFMRAAIEGTPLTLFGEGRQARDFTYVADVVDATKAAAASPVDGGIINVGAGAPTSLTRALDVIRQLVGGSLTIVRGPEQWGDVLRTQADTTSAQTLLGYEPSVSLETGLGLQFEWLLESQRSARRRVDQAPGQYP